MNNKYTELMVDSNNPYLLMGIVAISLLLTVAVYFFLKSRTFIPGSQYNYIMKRLGRGSAKGQKKLDTKQIIKEERKRQAKKEKNIQLMRIRWNMNYEEFNTTIAQDMLKGLIIGFAFGLMALVLTGKLQILFILISVGSFLYFVGRLTVKYTMDTGALAKDVLKDLARMVSLYRYSDTSRGFFGLVQDYLPTSNALKKDLEIYMADLNSYGEDEALDRLGARISSKEIFKLITYIKSSATATRSEFEANLNILDREMSELLQELYRKESKRRFAMALFLMIPMFAAVLLIYIAPQVVDIQNALTQSF